MVIPSVDQDVFLRVFGVMMVISLVSVAILASPIGANHSLTGKDGRIACASNADGDQEIVYYNPDGSDRRQVTSNELRDIGPTWSPDGTRIAFARGPHAGEDIWIMYQDGSGMARLTNNGIEDRAGSFTPDGERIAFHSARPNPNQVDEVGNEREIMIMDDDGTNQTFLTANNLLDTFAHVSPDGEKIAFTSQRDGNFNVYTMDIDGTNQKRVTLLGVEDAHASWSPDGTELVFHSRRGLHAPALEIYRKNADGSGQATRLTHDATTADGNNFDAFPVWSPSGNRIAWTRNSNTSDTTLDTFTMNANDGSNMVNVSENEVGDWDQRCDWEKRKPCTNANVYCGTDGDDDIQTGPGDDIVYAGAGDDDISTGKGSDIIFAERGSDTIDGGGGADTLFGDHGDDVLKGGKGDDIVSGSEGTDKVSGGKGTDECGGETESKCELALNASG